MKINLVESEIKTELKIVFIDDLNKIKNSDKLEKFGFEAKDESCVLISDERKIYVGYEKRDYDSLALMSATAIKKAKRTKFSDISVDLSLFNESEFKAILEGMLLSDYEFLNYKSKKEEKNITLSIIAKDRYKKFQKIVDESLIITKAVNKARDMINTPPADFYPKTMAKIAKKLAKDANITCRVEGEKYLKKNKMNSMYSVGIASIHKSKLIHLTYKPKNAKKKLVLVGKGLTYDSGGLSLKPSDYMTTMKSDKSGACAVLSAIWAISKLELDVEVHVIIGAVENMIGGDAYKPDDVLKAKNGKTIEVKNTDAEGRLVLCDCLCYAQDEIKDIDYIFDFATLTGACVVGVGEYTTGIMGNNEELKNRAKKASLKAGEFATTLDFNRHLKKTLKSQIADMCNISNTRYGGAITAGIFLDNFIEDRYKDKWLHFDIAGPAFVEKQWGYNPYGASGAGVRAIIEFSKNIDK